MYHDAVRVKCLDDFELHLAFGDGKSGAFDCKPRIAKGGVFARLRDPEVFKRVTVSTEVGLVTWNDEVDIAPETACREATGTPLPAWMQALRFVLVCGRVAHVARFSPNHSISRRGQKPSPCSRQ